MNQTTRAIKSTINFNKHRDDKAYIIKKVGVQGDLLYYASERLKNDAEVVRVAITNDYLAMAHCSDELRNSKEFMMRAVRINGNTLRYASYAIQDDDEVVFGAVINKCDIFYDIGERFKDDKEMVAQVLIDNPSLITGASKRLQSNPYLLVLCIEGLYKMGYSKVKSSQQAFRLNILKALNVRGYSLASMYVVLRLAVEN